MHKITKRILLAAIVVVSINNTSVYAMQIDQVIMQKNDIEACKFIRDITDPNTLDTLDKSNILAETLYRHRFQLAEILIKRNISLTTKNMLRETPLHICIYLPKISFYEVATPNDELFYTFARKLIAKKAGLCTPNHVGRTPLMAALAVENFEIAKILIEQDAALDITDSNGDTPLHICIKSSSYKPCYKASYMKLATKLIEKKVSLTIKNLRGETPLQLTQQQELQETVEELKKYESQFETCILAVLVIAAGFLCTI